MYVGMQEKNVDSKSRKHPVAICIVEHQNVSIAFTTHLNYYYSSSPTYIAVKVL